MIVWSLIVSEYQSAILIVDDDKTNLDMSAAVLESIGAKADKALSGRKAIEMCAAKDYRIIFMDIDMPDYDGYQTTRAIKKMNHKSAHATIVALSATLTSKEQVLKCLEAGMKGCMVKPLDAEDIKTRFAAWKVH